LRYISPEGASGVVGGFCTCEGEGCDSLFLSGRVMGEGDVALVQIWAGARGPGKENRGSNLSLATSFPRVTRGVVGRKGLDLTGGGKRGYRDNVQKDKRLADDVIRVREAV